MILLCTFSQHSTDAGLCVSFISQFIWLHLSIDFFLHFCLVMIMDHLSANLLL